MDTRSYILNPNKTDPVVEQSFVFLPSSAKVLVLGAGEHGREVIPLAKLGHEVTALDIDVEVVKQLSATCLDAGISDRVTINQQDIFTFTAITEVFDAVYAVFALRFLQNRAVCEAVLKAAINSTKRQGINVISDLAVPPFWGLQDVLLPYILDDRWKTLNGDANSYETRCARWTNKQVVWDNRRQFDLILQRFK